MQEADEYSFRIVGRERSSGASGASIPSGSAPTRDDDGQKFSVVRGTSRRRQRFDIGGARYCAGPCGGAEGLRLQNNACKMAVVKEIVATRSHAARTEMLSNSSMVAWENTQTRA